MQPNPPQPGRPPMVNEPTSPGESPPKATAHAAAAVIACILAMLTAGMFVWFAFYNVVFAEMTDDFSSLMLVNVLGGAVGAGSLLVAAGFTFTRRIAGAWTLCGLCLLYVVAVFFTAPLLWGTPFSDQLEWIFGFNKSNGVAIALSIIFGALTALTAAIAGSLKSYEPTANPPRP